MLLETMSYDEMREEISKDWASIQHHVVNDRKQFLKQIKNYNNQVLYFQKTSDFVTKRRNKYKILYHVKNKTLLLQIFVELQTTSGKDYLIFKDIGITHLTSHYIKRFKERNSIPNFKESLLLQYLSKEMIEVKDIMDTKLSRFYIVGQTGLLIVEDKSTEISIVYKYITYMNPNDLSETNDLIHKMIK